MGDVFFDGFGQVFILEAGKLGGGFAVQTAVKEQAGVIEPSAREVGMALQQGFVVLFGGFPPAFAAGKRGAGKEGDVGVVFGLSGIAVEQGTHGLPVAAVDGVKQGFALVGFGIGFGCLSDVFGWNVEAVFAHFLFLFLHGLAGILPQALRGTVV